MGAKDNADEAALLPERLVTALLMTALQSPAGQQLWLGYIIARDDLPWLQQDAFRLTHCRATVEHVPGGRSVLEQAQQAGGANGVALTPAGG